jgi:hypothetical protein
MERDLNSVDGCGFSVILCRDLRAFVESKSRQALAGFCYEISGVAAISVIGVGVRDDRFLDRPPWIDMKITLLAIEPARCESYQPASFHAFYFTASKEPFLRK